MSDYEDFEPTNSNQPTSPEEENINGFEESTDLINSETINTDVESIEVPFENNTEIIEQEIDSVQNPLIEDVENGRSPVERNKPEIVFNLEDDYLNNNNEIREQCALEVDVGPNVEVIEKLDDTIELQTEEIHNEDDDEEEYEEKGENTVVSNETLRYNVNLQNEDFEGFKVGEHSEKVMNDIFGDSDEEDFEGFNENEIEKSPKRNNDADPNNSLLTAEVPLRASSDLLKPEKSNDILQSFEMLLEKQRNERRLNRPKRRTDVEFLNDLDDKVADLMNKMRLAAVEDEELYHMGQPGIKKMQLLPEVKTLLKRSSIKEVLIESKFLNIMSTWLKALPNQVLPPLDIRKTMLNALREFPSLSSDTLRESKIGKAVMYLLQHPKETPDNKKIAKLLINEWSRKVFKLSSNYKGMTREERLERDRAITNRRKLVDQDASAKKEKRAEDELAEASAAARPGEKNWIPRATMPKASNKDYVVRPNWRVKENNLKRENRDDEEYEYDEEEEEDAMNRLRPSLQKRMRSGQKNGSNTTLFERTYRRIKQSSKNKKTILRASKVSIQGRNMNI